jgi:hypothetical protein
MTGKASESDKAQREAEKLEARKVRNEAQAIEEQSIWGKLEEGAIKARETVRRKPKIHYSEALALEICEELSNGVSLQRICQRDDMPAQSAIYKWLGEEPFFKEIYEHARVNAAHTLFDAMKDIADDDSRDLLEDGSANNAAIARARLRVDTYARIAGKLAPRAYSERIETLAGPVTINNNTLQIDARALDGTQRENLRAMLLQARDAKTIDG